MELPLQGKCWFLLRDDLSFHWPLRLCIQSHLSALVPPLIPTLRWLYNNWPILMVNLSSCTVYTYSKQCTQGSPCLLRLRANVFLGGRAKHDMVSQCWEENRDPSSSPYRHWRRQQSVIWQPLRDSSLLTSISPLPDYKESPTLNVEPHHYLLLIHEGLVTSPLTSETLGLLYVWDVQSWGIL